MQILADEERKVNQEVWTPYPGAQTIALTSPAREVGMLGSRGPGKTEVQIRWLARMAVQEARPGVLEYPAYKGAEFRLQAKDLKDWIKRATDVYCGKLGAKPSGQPTEFKFPGGPVIRTGHLQNGAYINYVGWEIHKMGIDEATHIPTVRNRATGIPECPDYQMLLASLRLSPDGNAQALLTGNPGPHPGVAWVKHRFIDVYINGKKVEPRVMFKDPVSGNTRIFVNSSIFENQWLIKNDPGYIRSLQELSPMLQKAWIWGDWDTYEGQFFDFVKEEHVISPEQGKLVLPPYAYRWLSMDWGYEHPCAVYGHGQGMDGRVHTYKELFFGTKVGSFEVGVEVAKAFINDLAALPDTHRQMSLYLSHDAFLKRDEGDRVVESLLKGMQAVLGKKGAFILELSQDEYEQAKHDPDAALSMMLARRAQSMDESMSIAIVRAKKNTVSAWDYVREMMRYRRVEITAEPDPEHIRRLQTMPGGETLVLNYLSNFRDSSQDVLPKWVIWENCQELIKTIPEMVPDPDHPENMLNQDGDDCVSAACYGIAAHQNQQNQMPLPYYLIEQLKGAYFDGKIDMTTAHFIHLRATDEYNKEFGESSAIRLGRTGQRRGLGW